MTKDDQIKKLQQERDDYKEALEEFSLSAMSHIEANRNLLAELHPRKTLDIKRRVDGVETWFQGDWLTDVYHAHTTCQQALNKHRGKDNE